MTSTELVRTGALALDPTQTDWTERQLAALAQLGIDDAPAGDLAVFLHHAQRTGLDPFAKQIYMIGRYDPDAGRKKYTIQSAIDGLRIVAERHHGLYGGQIGPHWCGPDGQWRDVWSERTPPVAARVGIIRKDWQQPVYGIAHFVEFAEYTRRGDLKRMWREKGAHMLAKCAEALGLRKAFPHDLSGIYTPEEMAQADAAAAYAEQEHTQHAAPPPAPARTQRAEAERIDWDAEIAKREGDPDALRDLYNMARGVDPNNHALAERLAAAGKAAKEAADAARAEQDQAAEATAPADAEPIDGEVVDEQPSDQPAAEQQQASRQQLTAIATMLGKHDVTDRDQRLAVVSLLVGDRVSSMNALSYDEAAHVLAAVPKLAKDGQFADTVAAALAAAENPAESPEPVGAPA